MAVCTKALEIFIDSTADPPDAGVTGKCSDMLILSLKHLCHLTLYYSMSLTVGVDGCLPAAHRVRKDVKTCLYSSTLSIIYFYGKIRTYTGRFQYAFADGCTANFDTPPCFYPDGEGAVSHRPLVAWLGQEWFQMVGA